MPRHLLIAVHLHEGRYHGAGEWRPSPARLFQALVAGVARGALDHQAREDLEWLEALAPPIVGYPRMHAGQSLEVFVPNNDLDSVGGRPDRIGEIRCSKVIQPQHLDRNAPFLFAWEITEQPEALARAERLCTMASCIYQLGRGIDLAWAQGEVVGRGALQERLGAHYGEIHHPSGSGSRRTLRCPKPGSLRSLEARWQAQSRRLSPPALGEAARELFRQPPKPIFAVVPYGESHTRLLYDLRCTDGEAGYWPWPLTGAAALTQWARDGAATRLRQALPAQADQIERFVIGRKPDGADSAPSSSRIRIIPLPSIGHEHADRGIRRVLVEIPGSCPLRAEDVHWAFSGLELADPDTGEITGAGLVPAPHDTMLRHYGVGGEGPSRLWRTVTPAALPESSSRRRIDPGRTAEEAKGGAERLAEQSRAAGAVLQALRHAGVRARANTVAVQREPFEAKGCRAEPFAEGTRFGKERLWHVEVGFERPVEGPLVIGDGRFLGLGVMAPVRHCQGVHAFRIEAGLLPAATPAAVTRALRRAAIARVQSTVSRGAWLAPFFTGHERDGSPAEAERSPHLYFVFEPGANRLLVLAPHLVEHRAPTAAESGYLRTLDEAMAGFSELRAGSAGCLTVRALWVDTDSDPLFSPSRVWESVTPYQVTRHAKKTGAVEALSADVRAECRRRGLPQPEVIPCDLRGVPGVGLVGGARLTFPVAVKGPILLGRTRHSGGGLFRGGGGDEPDRAG